MLGKDHLEISLMFSLPFILCSMICCFYYDFSIWIAVVFPFSITIGSLLPDADCNGKPALYYRHQSVFFLMKPIYKFILFTAKQFMRKYPDYVFEVEEEHRGILHSLAGVFLSSILLSILLSMFISVFLYLVDLFSFQDIFYISISGFFGLLLGQILHLVEDSCTKSGVKWFLPFSNKSIRGNISTKSERDGRIDIRPREFAEILRKTGLISSFAILLIWSYKPEYLIYSIIAVLFVQLFTLIYLYSVAQQTLEGSRWHQNLKDWKRMKKKK